LPLRRAGTLAGGARHRRLGAGPGAHRGLAAEGGRPRRAGGPGPPGGTGDGSSGPRDVRPEPLHRPSPRAHGGAPRMTPATDIVPPARDRRTPWGVAGYYFFSLAGFAIASPYLPLYWRSLGYEGAALGTLLTMMGLGGLVAQAPIGYLSD